MTIEWTEPAMHEGIRFIKSEKYMITVQDGRYQASKRIIWENLGPTMSLKEAKQLCEEDNDK
jgi:hypothetical protein